MRQGSHIVHAGQLDRKVRLLKYVTTKNDAGETIQEEQDLGCVYARRVDATGSEDDDDGRVIGLGNVAFTMRLRKDIFTEIQSYMVQDFDGLFQVYSIELTGQKNSFMILKTQRRGSRSKGL